MKIHGASIQWNTSKNENERGFYTWCGRRTRGEGSVLSALDINSVTCKNCQKSFRKVALTA